MQKVQFTEITLKILCNTFNYIEKLWCCLYHSCFTDCEKIDLDVVTVSEIPQVGKVYWQKPTIWRTPGSLTLLI